MIEIIKRCPFCGQYNTVELTDEEYEAYNNKNLLIQEALPNRSATEREILKTGICQQCWDDMF